MVPTPAGKSSTTWPAWYSWSRRVVTSMRMPKVVWDSVAVVLGIQPVEPLGRSGRRTSSQPGD